MDKNTVNILLAEDDAITVLAITEFFSLRGYKTPRSVPSGAEAINAVSEMKPDILFIDIQLSGNMSGVEAAETIRKTSDVPIVFMSGYISKENRDRANRIKPAAFMEKPLIMQNFLNVIEKEILK